MKLHELTLGCSYLFLVMAAFFEIGATLGLLRFWGWRLRQFRGFLENRQGRRPPPKACAPLLRAVREAPDLSDAVLGPMVEAAVGQDLARIRLASHLSVPAGFLGTAAAMIGFLKGADTAALFAEGASGMIDWMRTLAPAFVTTAAGFTIALWGIILDYNIRAAANAVFRAVRRRSCPSINVPKAASHRGVNMPLA